MFYTYQRDKRDLWAYPQKGYFVEATFEKNGWGIFNEINRTVGTLEIAYYQKLRGRWSIGARAKGKYTFSRKQPPYNYQTSLGYFYQMNYAHVF